MKKVVVVIMLIIILFMLSSCDDVGIIIERTDTYDISDWISPDGVHYWLYEAGVRFGIVPRYGSDGQLVIEDGEQDAW